MPVADLLIVNGDGAAGAVEAAGLARGPGESEGSGETGGQRVLVLRDVLSCGSLRDADMARDLQSWRVAREEFWRKVWRDARRVGWVDEPFGAVARLPDNVYGEAETLARADRVLVGVGAGLSDQLMLAFLVAWFERLDLEPSRLRVADIARGWNGRPDAIPAGLPHLDARALSQAWSPRALEDSEWKALAAFWDDYAGGNEMIHQRWAMSPDAGGDAGVPSILESARMAWASRFPAPPDHLAGWDRALLQASSSQAIPLRDVIGGALQNNDVPADPVGDLMLLHRIVSLSGTPAERAWWTLGRPRGQDTSCVLTARGAQILGSGTGAAGDPRARDWIWGLAPV